jgi:hypothetical protein
LVTKWCVNYDSEYGCLPLDGSCYMLGKHWTGTYCRYFNMAVLPNDPVLEAALMGSATDIRPCAACGNLLVVNANRVYCSTGCAGKARRTRQRGYMRKRREKG